MDKMVAYLFSGFTSSTRLSKSCRGGVAVEAVDEAWSLVSLNLNQVAGAGCLGCLAVLTILATP